MTQWWHWQSAESRTANSFAVIGVGRFGSSVCRELLRAGAEVLAIDNSQRAIDELRQTAPEVEARVVDCGPPGPSTWAPSWWRSASRSRRASPPP
jgi:trk system potassium uptake protein TrkA